jgi:hypothetical protein
MIRVNEKWGIDADSMCYILKRFAKRGKGKNKGEDCEIVEGYFSSPQEALKRIYDTEVRNKIMNTDLDLQAAIAEIDIIRGDVIKEIKNIKGV